jgi:glutathionylspermidine synthase
MVTKKMTTIYFIKNQNLNNFIYKLFNNMNDTDTNYDSEYIFVDIINDSIIMDLENSFVIVNCNESKFDKFWKFYKNTNNLMNSTFLKSINKYK